MKIEWKRWRASIAVPYPPEPAIRVVGATREVAHLREFLRKNKTRLYLLLPFYKSQIIQRSSRASRHASSFVD